MADPFSITSDQLAGIGATPQQLSQLQQMVQSGSNNSGSFSSLFGGSGAVTANTAGAAGASGLGLNIGTGQLALGGLGALGNLWTAWNATELAKKQFDFQKKLGTANYYNQMQTYNTNLEDRAYARYAMENKSPAEADAYISSHRLRPMV